MGIWRYCSLSCVLSVNACWADKVFLPLIEAGIIFHKPDACR
jgi:hypothetical protein